MIFNFEHIRPYDDQQKNAYLDSILENDQAAARGVLGMIDYLQSVTPDELAARHLLEFSPLNFALSLRACRVRDAEQHVIHFIERSVDHCLERESTIAARTDIDEATRTMHALQASEYELVEAWWSAQEADDELYEQSA